MNIFRVLASGKQSFREEYISAFLAYLFSPKMDHGLGASILVSLLEELEKKHSKKELSVLAHKIRQKLREDIWVANVNAISVELEVPYTYDNKSGFIDIVIRSDKWFIAIENKIFLQSFTKGQVHAQYHGLKQILNDQYPDHQILFIYLVPAQRDLSLNGWSTSQKLLNEIPKSLSSKDFCTLLTWHPTEDTVSFVDILRGLLKKEAIGDITPISYDTRQILLAFIDFILGEFQGYPYEKTSTLVHTTEKFVAQILTDESEDFYVGIQYGMAGLINKAWKNPDFQNTQLPTSVEPRGWQYLRVSEFRKVANWAMTPETQTLENVDWSGKPFWTKKLLLVAKATGDGIYIGIRGGLAALQTMSATEIIERKSWEIGTSKIGNNWFSGSEFCKTLEDKGILINFDNVKEDDSYM